MIFGCSGSKAGRNGLFKPCMDTAGSDGVERDVEGCRPMVIDGKMALCGRSDDTTQRGYTGSLAELAIWDAGLTADQVSAVYRAVSILQTRTCSPREDSEAHDGRLSNTHSSSVEGSLGTSAHRRPCSADSAQTV